MFGSSMHTGAVPKGTEVPIEGCSKPAIVHKNGMLIFGNDGKMVRYPASSVNSASFNMKSLGRLRTPIQQAFS